MFHNSVKLPLIILIATLCSLLSPDPTAFFFCVGQELPRLYTKVGKSDLATWDYTSWVLWGFPTSCSLNKSSPTSGQLCICCSHELSIQLKSLNRRHCHGATQQITQCTRIIMICCHHLPKFFLPKCLDGWIRQSFRPPKFCAMQYLQGCLGWGSCTFSTDMQ